MEHKKDYSIEFLRGIATLAIVYLHMIAFWSQSEAHYDLFYHGSSFRLVFDAITHAVGTRWGVPTFLMITGALLLNPEKHIDLRKVKHYVIRVSLVLLIFGTAFNFIELIFDKKAFNLSLLLEAFTNLLQGKCWNHLAYLFTLIGLYLLLPIMKAFTDNAAEQEMSYASLMMFILMIAFPTINRAFGLEITSFQIGAPVALFYFITGCAVYQRKLFPKILKTRKKYLGLFVLGGVTLTSLNLYGIIKNGELLTFNTSPSEICVAVMSVGLFGFVVGCEKTQEIGSGKLFKFLSKHSFCIYIVHPFFQHIIYKGLKIFPDRLPMIIGELAFWAIIAGLSGIVSIVLHKIPWIRKLI